MHFEEKTIKVIIDESKCAGCKTHVCADACKKDAMSMLRRDERPYVPANVIERSLRIVFGCHPSRR
jgi:Fe-S-cluster-containing dehydrogenase component